MLTSAALKTLTKHRENEATRENGTGEQRHQGNQRNPLNPSKIKGKLFNTHQNSSRDHQGSSRISQNHFLIHVATKSNTLNPKGTAERHPGGLIEVQSPSEGITHAGPIKISRFGHTPQTPTTFAKRIQRKRVF